MMSAYANQQIPWKQAGPPNEYNEPTYPLASTIRARVDFGQRMIHKDNGEQITSEATVYTKTAVNVNDKLTINGTEWIVKGSSPMYDLAGNIEFYEVML